LNKQNKRCKDKKKSILYKQMQQHEKVSRASRLLHSRHFSLSSLIGARVFVCAACLPLELQLELELELELELSGGVKLN